MNTLVPDSLVLKLLKPSVYVVGSENTLFHADVTRHWSSRPRRRQWQNTSKTPRRANYFGSPWLRAKWPSSDLRRTAAAQRAPTAVPISRQTGNGFSSSPCCFRGVIAVGLRTTAVLAPGAWRRFEGSADKTKTNKSDDFVKTLGISTSPLRHPQRELTSVVVGKQITLTPPGPPGIYSHFNVYTYICV